MEIPKKTKAAILFEQKQALRLENIYLPEIAIITANRIEIQIIDFLRN